MHPRSNLTNDITDHVDQCLDLAIQLHRAMHDVCTWLPSALEIRIGIHTGPAVACVVGNAGTSGLMRYVHTCSCTCNVHTNVNCADDICHVCEKGLRFRAALLCDPNPTDQD